MKPWIRSKSHRSFSNLLDGKFVKPNQLMELLELSLSGDCIRCFEVICSEYPYVDLASVNSKRLSTLLTKLSSTKAFIAMENLLSNPSFPSNIFHSIFLNELKKYLFKDWELIKQFQQYASLYHPLSTPNQSYEKLVYVIKYYSSQKLEEFLLNGWVPMNERTIV
jgi:hypothetical protein